MPCVGLSVLILILCQFVDFSIVRSGFFCQCLSPHPILPAMQGRVTTTSAFPSIVFEVLMRCTAPSLRTSLCLLDFQMKNSTILYCKWCLYLIDCSPLFVTWNTRSSRPGKAPRLRGCIGTFEPISIREGLAEYALISAFQDHRFRKIEEWELENLECGYATCPLLSSSLKLDRV